MSEVPRISVASYNIHRCVGGDSRCDPERIATVLNEVGADVIALQEVDADHWVAGGLDQLEFLAQATGFFAVEGATLRSHRGHYGNGLLTRLPLRAVRRHDLTFPGREPRGAIDADIEVYGRPLRVVATHLGLGRRERRLQLRALARLVDQEAQQPVVLLGDMNEWIPGALRALHRRLAASPRLRTFPAYRPVLALDRMWARPQGSMRDVRVHRSAIARIASDHLPLVASITL